MKDRIHQIQEEYFEFCIELLQKVPEGDINLSGYSQCIYQLKEALNIEILEYKKSYKTEAIIRVEEEIAQIRRLLQQK